VKWCVWFITYGSYEDVAQDGDIKPRMVAGQMSFGAAHRVVEERGVGYCMKPVIEGTKE
jgi:hypothetical protein